MIRGLVIGTFALHGVIHGLGFAKAFGLAPLPQLQHPISRRMGLVWLSAGLLCLGAAASLGVWAPGWWLTGAMALGLSQFAILRSWSDAKFGTLVNLLLLSAVVYAGADKGF